MDAGRALKAARRRAGMTQRELADASGVPQPSIARIERGASIPRFDTIQRLLQASTERLALGEAPQIDVIGLAVGCDVDAIGAVVRAR